MTSTRRARRVATDQVRSPGVCVLRRIASPVFTAFFGWTRKWRRDSRRLKDYWTAMTAIPTTPSGGAVNIARSVTMASGLAGWWAGWLVGWLVGWSVVLMVGAFDMG